MMRLLAQEEASPKERAKLSGQVIFLSSTNSSVTGGFFSQTPAIRGMFTASKSGFAISAGRNSDLIDPKSNANVNIIVPSYIKTFGIFSAMASVETYLFDQNIEIDIICPALTLALKGVVNLELFVVYGFAFQSADYDNMYAQRLAISKDYAGYTFKLTGWNTYWGSHRHALALEISKGLTERLRLFVSGNFNHNYDANKTQKFGVVRLAYSF